MDPAIGAAQTPALQPPPGVTSNFVDPLSRASLGRIVIGVTLPLMILFLALRVYTRLSMSRTLSVDDWICLVGAAVVIAYSGVMLALVGNPLGPHQWDVPLSQFNARTAKLTLSATCLYALGSLFVKCALLVLYLRIFRQIEHARAMIWAGVVVIVLFYTITIVINIVDCVPIERHASRPNREEWEDILHRDQCFLPVYYLSAAQGVFSVASDFYVLAIPMSLVVHIRVPKARKIAINIVFLTGLLACILSIISTVFRFKQLNSMDYTWDSIPIYFLRAAELNIGLICSCFPVAFLFFRRLKHTALWNSLERFTTALGRRRALSAATTEYSKHTLEQFAQTSVPHEQLPRVPESVVNRPSHFV